MVAIIAKDNHISISISDYTKGSNSIEAALH